MAKSRGKSKIKVPKRVAGVKIPKAVRKGPVVDFVNSSAGRLLVAQALTAAVAAFAIKQSDSPAGERVKAGAKSAEDMVKQNTARLGFAFAEGVRAFREALSSPPPDALDPIPDGDPDVEATDDVIAKKKATRRFATPSDDAGRTVARQFSLPAKPKLRERALLAVQRWASREIERRIRAEWREYQRTPEVKLPLFGRRRAGGSAQVSRSLIQINFIRGPDTR
jgi:hypothetical protein